MDPITKEIKKVLLAGLGAAAEGREKGGKLLDDLAAKGEVVLEHGKVLNEELRHNIKKTISGGEKGSDLLNALKDLDSDQLGELKAQIEQVEKDRANIAELREKYQAEVAEIKEKFEAELAGLKEKYEAVPAEEPAAETTEEEKQADEKAE